MHTELALAQNDVLIALWGAYWQGKYKDVNRFVRMRPAGSRLERGATGRKGRQAAGGCEHGF
jgi:hypothetical protein